MCILWSKYYDIKFGGGVKVNTINIKRGGALGLGVFTQPGCIILCNKD